MSQLATYELRKRVGPVAEALEEVVGTEKRDLFFDKVRRAHIYAPVAY